MITYRKNDIPEHLARYFEPAEIGLEPTPDEYVAKMVDVFRAVRRVLRGDGTVWMNLGDSYGQQQGKGFNTNAYTGGTNRVTEMQEACGDIKLSTGLKPKNLLGIPWRVAFALQADGWYLRQDIIWAKPNPMPESVTDRCTKAHEYIFLLSKSARYYYDAEAIQEENSPTSHTGGQYRNEWKYAKLKNNAEKSGMRVGVPIPRNGRNRRSVWTVTTKPFAGAHFAVFPPDLIEPCILAGAPEGGVVLDPFAGSGTTGIVAEKHGRRFVGCELNPAYAEMARQRIARETSQGKLEFAEVQHA